MHYTPLNASRSYILDQALATEILVMPKRSNSQLKVDFSKWCQYHQSRGHSTKECDVLKDKIEDLIKLGHLKDLFTSLILIDLITIANMIKIKEETRIENVTITHRPRSKEASPKKKRRNPSTNLNTLLT